MFYNISMFLDVYRLLDASALPTLTRNTELKKNVFVSQFLFLKKLFLSRQKVKKKWIKKTNVSVSTKIQKTLLLFYSFDSFHNSVSWWFSFGVWMTVSPLKSPGLFFVFWPISTMQYFGWYPPVLLFPSPPVPELFLWWVYRARQ